MPSADALAILCVHMKADPTYVGVKDVGSRRWHVRTPLGEHEILTTGVKWYDTRASVGGGGAIDLAMHLLRLGFVDAVKLLNDRACGSS